MLSSRGALAREATRDDWLLESLLLVLALVPLDLAGELATAPGYPDVLHRVNLLAWDVPGLALVFLAARPLAVLASQHRRSALTRSVSLLVVLTCVSAAVHPSWLALQSVVRLAECLAIAYAVATAGRRSPRALLGVVALPVLLEAGVTIAQVARGRLVGLHFLGESPPLLPVGHLVMGNGTFPHPYQLAGWAAVVAGSCLAVAVRTSSPRIALGAAVLTGVACIPLALTFCRMTVVGCVLALPPLAWAAVRSRRYRLPVTAAAVGLLVPALVALDGWLVRGAQTTGATGTSADAISSGRVEFIRQALGMIRHAPLLGVGPGQYAIALPHYLGVSPDVSLFPVHDVPLLVAAECGVIAGLACVAVLVTVCAKAWRTPEGWALLAMYLPFLLLDLPYGLPQGLPVVALWAGVALGLGGMSRRSAAGTVPSELAAVPPSDSAAARAGR